MTVSQTFLFFKWLWQFWGLLVICRMFFHWDYSDVFLMTVVGSWVLERKTRDKCHFTTSRQRITVNTPYPCCWGWPWWSGWDHVYQVSHRKVLSVPLSTLHSLETRHYKQPTLKGWGVMLLFLEGWVSTGIIWNCSRQEIHLFFPFYLFIPSLT